MIRMFAAEPVKYTVNTLGHYAIAEGNSDMSTYSGDITIEDTYTSGNVTYNVKYLKQASFQNWKNLKNVTIKGNNLVEITSYAFNGCTSLESINIPSSVTAIRYGAFKDCSALSSVTGLQQSSVSIIDSYAFYNCPKITSWEFPTQLGSIGEYAFYNLGTSNLNIMFDFTFPSSLKSIGEYAFSGVNVNSLNIPSSLTFMGDGAFSLTFCSSIKVASSNPVYDSRNNCNAIVNSATNRLILGCKKTTIPEGIESIAPYAFYNLKGLEYVTIPKSVKSIGTYAFAKCEGIKSFVVKGDLTVLEDNLFEGSSVTNIELPSTIQRIEKYGLVANHYYANSTIIQDFLLPLELKYMAPNAAKFMYSMNSITIPSKVQYLGANAINYSTLNKVYCMGDVPAYSDEKTFAGSTDLSDMTLVVKPQYKEKYKNTLPWSRFGTFEDWVNVTSISMRNTSMNISVNCSGKVDCTVLPSNATLKNVSWSSSDESVATVDESGYVTVHKAGKAIIRATAIDGSGVYGECHINGNTPSNVASVTLTDDGTEQYYYNEYRRATKLTYKRKFTSDKWQALYVPFSMSYNDWKNDFVVARLNAVRMYDTDEDGEIDVTEVEILKINSGTLYPNHPYFIKAINPSNDFKTITLSNALVYPSNEESISCSTIETEYIFRGTYTGVSGDDMVDHKYYALANGQFCYTTTRTAKLGSYRWYLDVQDKGSQLMNTSSSARLRITVSGEDALEDVEDLEDATGIAEALDTPSFTSDDLFSIDGRKITSNKSTLRPGMYIQNGSKFIVR